MPALGIDIGGTFTDCVLVDAAGRVRLLKLLSTPDDPARSVLAAVEALALPPEAGVVHGSTVATNALLERRGARTALITTAGFADVLEIGRQNRPDLYALVPVRPAPLVPRAWRFEVHERVDARGQVITPLQPAEVIALRASLDAEGIESVAVCLLFSYLRPEHERTLATLLAGYSISLSSDVLPEFREFERTATTVINAYVAPLVDRYLGQLEQALAPRPLAIMQSNGGTISAALARRCAARIALSGPAGGVVGARHAASQALGPAAQIVTFDMGGTSTDVCLCPGWVPFTSEGEIAALGLPLRLPMIDIHTVGAGGGSLAQVDAGGALRVGPGSAGARPGPAAYGLGGQAATVTDANLVLGRLAPDHFLGGQMRLSAAAAEHALARLAQAMGGAGVPAAAWGVLQVANAAMERAVRRISVERGYDPAGFTLVAFGGAGPLHACELAERLGMPQVLVPRAPGVLSALGMLVADRVKDYSATLLRPAAALSDADLPGLFAPLENSARVEMAAELAAGAAGLRLENSADLRYQGQAFELNVPLEPGPGLAGLVDGFHALHQQRYGHSHPAEPVEVVNLRVRAVVPGTPPEFEPLPAAGDTTAAVALVGEAPAWFAAGDAAAPRPTRRYNRERLLAGHTLSGPAVIYQLDATTVVPPGWLARVDRAGHLVLNSE
jgi:N-methylhydantoinase A